MAFEETIADYLELLQVQIKRNLSDQNVNATGDTSRSVQYTSDETEGQLFADENIVNTEDGNPPASQGGGISLSAAMLWVEVKGVDLKPSSVKKNIDTAGTKLYRQGGRTTIYTDVINNDRTEDLFFNEVANDVEEFIIGGFDL